jgi:hypothetical protein
MSTTPTPEYHDPRADLWRSAFTKAVDYETYLHGSPHQHSQRWRDMEPRLPALTADQRGRLTGYHRTLHILVLSGVWCGDCVRQVPMIHQIARAIGDDCRLRIIDREADEKLRDELRIVGAARVPIAVYLTEDFWELLRFGDRSLTAYRAKSRREVGPACSLGILPPPPDELAAEQAEWVDTTERALLMARLSPPLRQKHND